MDAGMWKCHRDYRSADLWFRASCQRKMPSCYLHSFKRREKTAEILESKKRKRGRGVETSASGDLAENKKTAEPSKLLSPTPGKLLSELPRAGGHPLPTAGLLPSPCSLQPGTWEDRRKETPLSILGRNTLILRCPGTPREPASTTEPVMRSLFAGAGQATSSVLHSKRAFLLCFAAGKYLLSYISRKE